MVRAIISTFGRSRFFLIYLVKTIMGRCKRMVTPDKGNKHQCKRDAQPLCAGFCWQHARKNKRRYSPKSHRCYRRSKSPKKRSKSTKKRSR